MNSSILVTGANGFLGYYLAELLLKNNYTLICTGKGPCRLPFTLYPQFIYEEMDITDPYRVHDIFEKYRPDVVVHAGAISKVDECELDQWKAYSVNTEATVNLLMNAEECRAFFLFVSTDFIFDGKKGMYTEDDEPGPVNFYGKTKLQAEEAVREYDGQWAIVRTVLVYGKPQVGRGNILSIVKDKLEKGESYRVVDDQVRTPTFVGDLAAAIMTIIQKNATGVFHIAGDEVMTPYHMARKAAEFLGLDKELILRVTQENFSQPALRPLITSFTIEKAKSVLGYQPLSFDQGLRLTYT